MFSCFLIGFEPVLIMFTRVCPHISLYAAVSMYPIPRVHTVKIQKVILNGVKKV
jgi:hypothetical protein